MQKNMDIVLNKEWNWNFFNPVVYNNEPYDENISAKTFFMDYLQGLGYLLDDYKKTGDMRYIALLNHLLPPGVDIRL